MKFIKEYGTEGPHQELTLNDSYRFECQRCGSCCSEPGYFSPQGITKVANHLGLSRSDFFRQYCELPLQRIVITPRKKSGYCTFLGIVADGRPGCRIHEVKPANCSYLPLSPKRITIDFQIHNSRVILDENSTFALPTRSCGSGRGPLISVRETVNKTGMESDLTCQLRSLVESSFRVNPFIFMQMTTKKLAGEEMPLDFAEKLRIAIMQSYGLSPELLEEISE